MIGTFGPVDVAVDHRDPAAALAERDREVDRDGRLSHTTLAGAHRDDVLHAGHGRLARFRRERRSDLRRHLDLDAGDAGNATDQVPRLIAHLILHRARGCRQLDGERHSAAVDPQVLDELERDDVAVEIGVPNGLQGLEDGCLCGLRGAHDGKFIVTRGMEETEGTVGTEFTNGDTEKTKTKRRRQGSRRRLKAGVGMPRKAAGTSRWVLERLAPVAFLGIQPRYARPRPRSHGRRC